MHQTTLWTPDGTRQAERLLAHETPVVLEYNCQTFAVMMATPADLEDYAYGFSLTEGIIEAPREILNVEIKKAPKGLVAAIEITPQAFQRLEDYNRTLAGRTGCGLCGVDRLEQAIRPLKKINSDLKVPAKLIHRAMQDIGGKQTLNKKTGALHAAAFVNEAGNILHVREDLGRHNALDKLIGALLRQNIDPANGFILITSRCSFEMVHKCATFGSPLLVAVSATTELALSLAEEAGLTLIAFARTEGLNIYTDPGKRVL